MDDQSRHTNVHSRGSPRGFKEQRNNGKISHGTREHEPVLRNAGTTKPLLIFFDVDVDAGGINVAGRYVKQGTNKEQGPSLPRQMLTSYLTCTSCLCRKCKYLYFRSFYGTSIQILINVHSVA